jgi:hypothetical protein
MAAYIAIQPPKPHAQSKDKVKKPKKASFPAEQPAEQLPSKTKTKPERKAELKSKK